MPSVCLLHHRTRSMYTPWNFNNSFWCMYFSTCAERPITAVTLHTRVRASEKGGEGLNREKADILMHVCLGRYVHTRSPSNMDSCKPCNILYTILCKCRQLHEKTTIFLPLHSRQLLCISSPELTRNIQTAYDIHSNHVAHNICTCTSENHAMHLYENRSTFICRRSTNGHTYPMR